MTNLLSIGDIDKVLARWASGELSQREVHGWAEDRFATDGWEAETDAANEVLGHLDRMDMNLVLVSDVPLLREALLANSQEAASQIIERSYAITPIASRKLTCAGDAFYAPFCK